jgi:hypothetical protein
MQNKLEFLLFLGLNYHVHTHAHMHTCTHKQTENTQVYKNNKIIFYLAD